MKQILLTQRVEIIEGIQERRDAISQEWIRLADACGFLPLLVPNHLPTLKKIAAQSTIDGILLTGGNDLCAYGGNAPERDEMEHTLIAIACERKIPLLGVCRGMQLLLDHFGSPLEQVGGHVRTEHSLNNGDKVNSYHNWGARTCKPPLLPILWAGDGVIEAIKHQSFPNLFGIMWHPERYPVVRDCDKERLKEVFQL